MVSVERVCVVCNPCLTSGGMASSIGSRKRRSVDGLHRLGKCTLSITYGVRTYTCGGGLLPYGWFKTSDIHVPMNDAYFWNVENRNYE